MSRVWNRRFTNPTKRDLMWHRLWLTTLSVGWLSLCVGCALLAVRAIGQAEKTTWRTQLGTAQFDSEPGVFQVWVGSLVEDDIESWPYQAARGPRPGHGMITPRDPITSASDTLLETMSNSLINGRSPSCAGNTGCLHFRRHFQSFFLEHCRLGGFRAFGDFIGDRCASRAANARFATTISRTTRPAFARNAEPR